MSGQITGREPRLMTGLETKVERRLSLRRFATMLNVLPPESVSLEAVREAIHNEEFLVRFNAAKLLARRGDRDSRMIMEEVLKHSDIRARASVARHLYGLSWYSAEPLLNLALADSDARVREAAMYALADLRDLNAYQLMIRALKDEESDDVREAAAFGLRDCQDSAAVPVLQEAFKARDPEVRIKVLEALGANNTAEAMPVVRQGLNDPFGYVKYAATLSLLELGGATMLEDMADRKSVV